MAFFRQLKYLVYKNFVLRKRHKFVTTIELLWPLVIFLILYYSKSEMFTALDPARGLNISQALRERTQENFRVQFLQIVGGLLPLLMILAYIFSAALLIKSIVYEKEVRLTEFMKVMGLQNFVHSLGWFIQTFIISFIGIALLSIALNLGGILKSNILLIIFAFSSYLVASISQCILMGAIFNKATVASAVSGFIYFLLYLPFGWVYKPEINVPVSLALCLIPQSCLSFICMLISDLEINQLIGGLYFDSIFTIPNRNGHVSMILPLIMCYVDAVLYYLAAWYIENVFPGEFGVPKPFYFCLTKNFWFGDYREETVRKENTNEQLKKYMEDDPHGFPVGVHVQNVSKVWPNGVKALDDLTLTFYQNQITSFLGHNGAGKTTTINILTGLVPPTTGTIYVNGKDVRKQMDEIRHSLGMCPQHNILYDMLTIEEQLHFYAGLKGLPRSKIPDEINRLLNILNLDPKRNSLAKELSGGQQRRLSIAIAFLGDSKTVVLDEPTAGVDPYSRRQIWDLMTMHKQGRTIILSTHFMDEADILGDRIAIISSGLLKCVGSGLFLKKAFGATYYLHLTTTNGNGGNNGNDRTNGRHSPMPFKMIEGTTNLSKTGKVKSVPNMGYVTKYEENRQLTALVTNHVPGGQFFERSGDDDEIVYSLPADNPKALYELFRTLENERTKENYGIVAFGISEMSLEEIFLKIDPIDATSIADATCGKSSAQRIEERGAILHCLYQIKAIFIKRFLNFSRNLKGFFAEIILPIIVIAASFVRFTSTPIIPTNTTTPVPDTHEPIFADEHDSGNSTFSQIKNPALLVTSALVLLLSFSIVPASFVMFMIDERVSGAKHMQFVNGLNPALYWIGNFIWDMINFSIPLFGVMIVFWAAGQSSFIGWPGNVTVTFLTLLCYGFAIIPMFYILSFIFKNSSAAFLILMLTNFICGAILFAVSVLFTLLAYFTDIATSMSPDHHKGPEYDTGLFKRLDFWFSFFPTYCLSSNVVSIYMNQFIYGGEIKEPFHWGKFSQKYVIMTCEGFIFLMITIFFENIQYWCQCIVRRWPPFGYDQKAEIIESGMIGEDEDVKAEREFADGPESHDTALKVNNLTKVYGTGTFNMVAFKAVKNISFTVRKGECFGLLGVNGAGKTTTFDMLTGKHSVTRGDAYFCGHSVCSSPNKVRQQIGYCPQFDALNLRLTGREHLYFYARLRGIRESEIQNVVDTLIYRLDLTKYATKLAGTYSGGNKRKLSTAIAIIGNPPVVMFDEPTTAMDPKARRFVWIKIQEMVKDGRSVVLTSHSMEECEFLCNRIGIMVAGRFQCMGTVQHLKHKFGGAYTLKVKLNGLHPKADEFIEAMKSNFPPAILKERHFAYLTYQFPVQSIPLSKLFGFVLDEQPTFGIEQYSLTQTSLEEIFLHFAQQTVSN